MGPTGPTDHTIEMSAPLGGSENAEKTRPRADSNVNFCCRLSLKNELLVRSLRPILAASLATIASGMVKLFGTAERWG